MNFITGAAKWFQKNQRFLRRGFGLKRWLNLNLRSPISNRVMNALFQWFSR
ncbi:hypothetical protein AVDCRST_MAG81-4546 [uncultured Synechococcales cyanobacterium]|uniref:Uncharacterized protein n=1 Tax=uncultured Synechococcales cyanobacterium TaxID=1936017 RepID=A0A6J4VTL6_9CYAN|nr:hypothetical protein AVDCRST_MAG81-4546 [uncultured Synechococcales cyanobacterium]